MKKIVKYSREDVIMGTIRSLYDVVLDSYRKAAENREPENIQIKRGREVRLLSKLLYDIEYNLKGK